MASKPNIIQVFQATASGNPTIPAPSGGQNGYAVLPFRGAVKRAADGTALAATPPVGAASGPTNPISGVVRNGAGDYTATLVDNGQTAAQVSPRVQVHTAGLYATCVVTDATHLALIFKTDAGVATDSIFSLSVDYLELP